MRILLHWLPRVLCVLAILFISMFALDAFDPRLTIWHQISGFLIHLLPSFTLVLFLLIAWKWELIGGMIFILVGLGFAPVIFNINYHRLHSVGAVLGILLMLNGPFVLVGCLFILNHILKRKKTS
jgi:hypothetical protein